MRNRPNMSLSIYDWWRTKMCRTLVSVQNSNGNQISLVAYVWIGPNVSLIYMYIGKPKIRNPPDRPLSSHCWRAKSASTCASVCDSNGVWIIIQISLSACVNGTWCFLKMRNHPDRPLSYRWWRAKSASKWESDPLIRLYCWQRKPKLFDGSCELGRESRGLGRDAKMANCNSCFIPYWFR